MKTSLQILKLAAAVAAFAAVSPLAQAGFTTYFGETLGAGEGTRLTPNAATTGAQASFLGGLLSPGVETFESFATGTGIPLPISFGNGVLATVAGSGAIATQPTGTNGVGRYPISGNNYWESGENLFLTFDQGVRAFGFYGVDIGDYSGNLKLDLFSGATLVDQVIVPNTVNGKGGSIIYFGVVTDYDFTKVAFTNTAAGTDYFGFDDFTVGLENQIGGAVPEPSTYGLMGAGILGLAIVLRRRLQKRS